jgi:hypothetical protein
MLGGEAPMNEVEMLQRAAKICDELTKEGITEVQLVRTLYLALQASWLNCPVMNLPPLSS